MFYLLITSFIWAFSFGLIKGDLTNLDPSLVSLIRLFISLIMFLPFLKFNKIKKISAPLLIVGAVQFGLMYIAYIYSFKFLKAHEVALFTIFTPIYVTLFNDLARKKGLNFTSLISAVLAIIGAGTIMYSKLGDGNFVNGILLAQCSSICFASGQLYYKKLMGENKDVGNVDVFAILYAGAVAITLLSTFFSGGFRDIAIITMQQLWVLLYLGIISSGIGFFLWNIGVVKSKVSTLAVMNDVKIPIAVLCSIIFFGETADWTKFIVGGGIMLAAVIISEKNSGGESIS
ncbi:MAG: EamA family transporter [Pseudomonadota bacterium]